MQDTPTTEQLAAMTPVEVDTELSRLWNEEAQAEARRLSLVISLHAQAGDKARRVRGARGPIFSLSWEKVLERAIVKARAPYTEAESRTAREVDKLLTNWAMASRKLEDLAAEIKVYTDEYVRRGRWNRVFMAQSHDGHAHNGMECSTCHRGEERTQFAWMIQYSGKTESEIIADAGERACTTCYPNAPVNAKGTKMFTPDEEEARKAREQREADRAARAADRTSKGITAPDGAPLRDDRSGRIETERAAVLEATSALSERYKDLRREQFLTADPGLTPFFTDKERRKRNVTEARMYAERLVEAIAHKRGTTTAQVLAELEPKAYAKAKRDLGGKDFVPTFRYHASFQADAYAAYLAQCKKEEREPFEALTLKWYKP